MALILLVIIGVVTFVIGLMINNWIRSKDLPPLAPGSYPLIGHMMVANMQTIHHQMNEWHKEVGPIYRVKFGPFSYGTIFVTGYDLIKEVLLTEGDKYHYRPPSMITANFTTDQSDSGIINSSGTKWKEQRRFSLSVLRDFGVGKASMEDRIDLEIDKLLEWFDKDIGNAGGKDAVVDPATAISFSVASIIANLIMGKDYNRGDQQFIQLQSLLSKVLIVSISDEVVAVSQCSALKYVPGRFANSYKRCIELNKELCKYFREVVEEHWHSYIDTDDPSDFIYAYIREIKKRQQEQNMASFSDDELIAIVGDLWIAGMETTATTLKWFLLYMLHYPLVQDKLYKEIIETVGLDRRVALADKPSLPYLQATIQELQRITSIADTTLFHCSIEDANLGGYRIPANAEILCALYCPHMDPEHFPDPHTLNPERFLEADGKTLKKHDRFMPFGAGKRVCLGESLAKMELFKITSAIVQRYEFIPVPGEEKPSLEAVRSLALSPVQYKCVIKHRRAKNWL